MHAALFLVLAFFTAAALWLLLYAEFLAITLVLVYVGAVMVLFLFVVMMLDINLDALREGFWGNLPLAAGVGIADGRRDGAAPARGCAAVAASRGRAAAGLLQHQGAGPGALHRLRLRLRAGRDRSCWWPSWPPSRITLRTRKETKYQDAARRSSLRAQDRRGPMRLEAIVKGDEASMIPLNHFLVLGALLFAIGVVGIFLNRKNLIVLLMAIELMLLAVNMNFIAFSHHLDDLSGQVFVFFILTVAAAESAIGLAILVALFRNLRSINVDDLGSLRDDAWTDDTLSCIAAFSPLVGAILAGFLGWKLGRAFAHTVTIASVAISFAGLAGRALAGVRRRRAWTPRSTPGSRARAGSCRWASSSTGSP